MVEISNKTQILYASMLAMSKAQIENFIAIKKLRPSLGQPDKRDNLRGLKLICCWVCNIHEIYTILEEATLEQQESEDSRGTFFSESTRQSSIRSNIECLSRKPLSSSTPIIEEEVKEEPVDQDLNETLQHVPQILTKHSLPFDEPSKLDADLIDYLHLSDDSQATVNECELLALLHDQSRQQQNVSAIRREKIRQFIEENSFYDVDLRRNIDREAEYVRNLRLEKLNREGQVSSKSNKKAAIQLTCFK